MTTLEKILDSPQMTAVAGTGLVTIIVYLLCVVAVELFPPRPLYLKQACGEQDDR